jgi:dihydrofolate reductase
VFVLSHYPHPPVDMEGGTTFHFVDDGIESALEQARAAAGSMDVLIGGGAATIRQYLEARLIDELHLVIVPVLLGTGERLFDHLDVGLDDYECVEHLSSPAVTHIRLAKVATGSR